METTQVKDIMIPLKEYPHVPSWLTLLQVMQEMEKWQIDFLGRKSLPRVVLVFDLDSRLHGTVRRRDILRGLLPDVFPSKMLVQKESLFDIEYDPNLLEFSYDKMVDGFEERASRPVSDVMIPVVETVAHDAHIVQVIYKMVNRNLSLIPVMQDKQVIGVVRSVDVFHVVGRKIFRRELGV